MIAKMESGATDQQVQAVRDFVANGGCQSHPMRLNESMIVWIGEGAPGVSLEAVKALPGVADVRSMCVQIPAYATH